MSWLELVYFTTNLQYAQLEEALLFHGALSITLLDDADQPLLEPEPGATPLWHRLQLKALFNLTPGLSPENPAGETNWRDQGILLEHCIKQHIKQSHPTADIARLASPLINCIGDENWQLRCMQDFKPMAFGKRLWVMPSWSPEEAEQEKKAVIYLDPGVAFGTGTHETTALCLKWLDLNLTAHITVIDYGCGSGILGLAALALGAKNIFGVDVDSQALLASRDNAKKNNMSSQATFFKPEEVAPILAAEPKELLIANILAKPLTVLANQFSEFVCPNGQILLSGILTSQVDSIIIAYEPWFETFNIQEQSGWVAISAQRKSEKI